MATLISLLGQRCSFFWVSPVQFSRSVMFSFLGHSCSFSWDSPFRFLFESVLGVGVMQQGLFISRPASGFLLCTHSHFICFWFKKKNVFTHRNHKLNKQAQEAQKQYAYLSVTLSAFGVEPVLGCCTSKLHSHIEVLYRN